MRQFVYHGRPGKVLFGAGTLNNVVQEVAVFGRHALVLSTPQQLDMAENIADLLGDSAVGVFAEAAMHTPVDVTERALALVREKGADTLVAIGGGSTTGLGKAIAYRTDLPQVVIPTTYAGSEMTPILGQTEGGKKTTLTSPSVLPETVIYDVELTYSLPASLTATSGMNAIAHAIEAIYARDRNPIITLMSEEAVRVLAKALPTIMERADDMEARADALYGAWLCGTALGSVGMALHHKLCHTLGGTFDLPHAETHTVVLPHATAFNAPATDGALNNVASALGAEEAGAGLYDLAKRIGAPTSLKELGMPEEGVALAARLATENPYWNPRSFEESDIRRLLEDAWQGCRPGSGNA